MPGRGGRAGAAGLAVAACLWCACAVPAAAGNSFAPPLYEIEASTLYEAGHKHGKLASERIRAWFSGDEVQALVAYVESDDGYRAFEALRRASSDAFPQQVLSSPVLILHGHD